MNLKVTTKDEFIPSVKVSIKELDLILNRIYNITQSLSKEDREKLIILSRKQNKKHHTGDYNIAYKLWRTPDLVLPHGIYIMSNNNVILKDEELNMNNLNVIFDNMCRVKNFVLYRYNMLNNILSIMISQLYSI